MRAVRTVDPECYACHGRGFHVLNSTFHAHSPTTGPLKHDTKDCECVQLLLIEDHDEYRHPQDSVVVSTFLSRKKESPA